jgi:hypothetical protein
MGGATFWGAVIVLATVGCAQRPAPRHSGAMEASSRMLQQLDNLESELATTNSENLTYSVLVDRHGKAEQMACHVTDEHIQEIHRLDVAQQKKVEEKRGKKRMTVASR